MKTLLLPLLAACAHNGPPRDLGDLNTDGTPLGDAAPLAHIAAALSPSGPATVGDLAAAEALSFASAPNPAALLSAIQAQNAAAENDGQALRVLSYNVGLLQANVLLVVPYRASPYLDERRPALPDLILEKGYDVLLLQEVWRHQDVRRFEEAAEKHGYQAFTAHRGRYNDGLMTLVKDSLIGAAPVDHQGHPYDARDPLEAFPGPNIKRGWLEVSFEHPTLGTLRFFNTHTQAWAEKWSTRIKEARELGRQVAQDSTGGEIVLLGGDLNAGYYYKDDVWAKGDGTREAGWFSNAVSVPLLLHYGGLTDAWLRGQSAEGALDEVTLGDAVPIHPERTLVEPYGDASWCEVVHGRAFTGTDCNVMYFQQYAGTEYPARLDHLLLRDDSGRVFVASSSIAFNDKVTFADLPPMEPSDHYGVEVTLRIKPR